MNMVLPFIPSCSGNWQLKHTSQIPHGSVGCMVPLLVPPTVCTVLHLYDKSNVQCPIKYSLFDELNMIYFLLWFEIFFKVHETGWQECDVLILLDLFVLTPHIKSALMFKFSVRMLCCLLLGQCGLLYGLTNPIFTLSWSSDYRVREVLDKKTLWATECWLWVSIVSTVVYSVSLPWSR